MSVGHYIGAIIVLLLIIILGLYSAKKANQNSFSGGKTATGVVVMGALIGTLVGGSSTIGTAQLAYSYGFSAWWFTLGGGIAVLFLGLLYTKNFYEKGLSTLPELIEKEYGKSNSNLVTILNSAGTFLSVVAQIISATALITAITNMDSVWAIIISIFVVLAYVIFGGALSLGYAGTLKTVLLSISVMACGILAISHSGGLPAFTDTLDKSKYFSLVARGPAVDLGAGLSLIVGVLTTQSYVSAIVMAKDKKEINVGTIITALLVPLIGVAGIFVGMYMKINYPDINSKLALPLFILNEMPDLIGGIMLGTLLLAVIGTAAGLSFGMAKMYYKNFLEKKNTNEIFSIRLIIVIVLAAAGVLSYGEFGQYILNWSFLSMGLRGAVAFIPIITALYCPGRINKKYATAAIIAGPIITFAGKFALPASIDSLFPGIAASLVIMLAGLFAGNGEVSTGDK